MAMKQTQTKLFDFSDVGLDFSAGSKALFPDRFKKMLANGYNPQTASSASITGDQVTLTYGVTHGCVAGRVLFITATGGYNKEVYIDSVTSSTVMFTDATATGLTGLINTKVASLGWELVYELANIHVYKMKHIDDTDRYVRMCFQDVEGQRNAIAICIGKSYDSATGFIDDINSLATTRSIMHPNAANTLKWDFSGAATDSGNNYTYSQGYAVYGRGFFVGSIYHFIMLNNNQQGSAVFSAILAASTYDYDVLKYPLFTCVAGTSTTSNNADIGIFDTATTNNPSVYIGGIRCRFDVTTSVTNNVFNTNPRPSSSALPSTVDGFNTTTCRHIPIYTQADSQFIGYCLGSYLAMYGNNATAPDINKTVLPQITTDIDLSNLMAVHNGAPSTSKSLANYIAIPIEEIKIA